MKRFYLFVLLTFVSIPLLAKNKISMVTYFPVPYVAYSQVNITEQMDIGLTSTCDMKLGCSDASATLNATQVNLKGGKLNLDGGRGIKGYTLSLGNWSGEGRISFQNVRIQTGNMESVNAADIKATNLNLFGKAFPSCKAANGESEGQMQWASLKLKGASSSELYLACGGLGDSSNECVVPDNIKEYKSCDNGMTGTKFRVFNIIECKWMDWDTSGCSDGRVSCCKIVKQSAYFATTIGSGGSTPDCYSKAPVENYSSIYYYGSRAYSEVSNATNSSKYCSSDVKEGVFLAGNKKGSYCYKGTVYLHSYSRAPECNYLITHTSDRYVCKEISAASGSTCNRDQITNINMPFSD